jgi:hypothetical protein
MLLGNISAPGPYEWSWTGKGNHTVVGLAYDMAGHFEQNSVSFSLALSQNQHPFNPFLSYVQNLLQWLRSMLMKLLINGDLHT